MIPSLVSLALNQQMLSGRILSMLYQMLEDKNESNESFCVKVELETGRKKSFRDLIVALSEQSYGIACSTFDMPQLAILAVNIQCSLCKRFPIVIDALSRLSQVNELAHARILTYGIGLHSLPLEGNFEALISYTISDFRSLHKRQHSDAVSAFLILCLVHSTHVLAPIISYQITKEQSFELMYLIAEYYYSMGDFANVLKIPEMHKRVWQKHLGDKAMLTVRKPTQMCIARALEATGQMLKARDLYSTYGGDQGHLENIDAYISGKSIYASVKHTMVISKGIESTFLSSRELPDGNLAVFFQQEGPSHLFNFHIYAPTTGSFDQFALPGHEQNKWKGILMVPDLPSKALRILVSSYDCASSTSDQGITEMLESMSVHDPTSKKSEKLLERVELWEFDNSNNSWNQIKTRGCIPDRLVVTRPGRACAIIHNRLVLFGGMDFGARSNNEIHSSAGPYVLDLTSLEWFRIPHPYRSSLNGDDPIIIRHLLPLFDAVWTTEIHGQQMVAMLSQGKADVNTKGDNEVVPKYVLDLFGLNDNGTSQPSAFWLLDVQTADRCGYIASMSPSCAKIGSTLLVLGSHDTSMVGKLQVDGTTQLSKPSSSNFFLDTSFLAFDPEQMEWRGINIGNFHPFENTTDDSTRKFLLVPSAEPATCHILCQKNNNKIQIGVISNLKSISRSFTKPLSARKRLSKKNTLSYQIAKAEKYRLPLLQECALCHIFETVNDKFKCCSKCKVPFYCSVNCQRRHWKTHHKVACLN